MKILIYEGKYNDIYFDVSTPEKEQRAYLALFNFMDKVCGYYQRLDCPDQTLALNGAWAGKWKEAKWLLQLRRDYEYEGWTIVHCVSEEEMKDWGE